MNPLVVDPLQVLKIALPLGILAIAFIYLALTNFGD